MNKRKLGNTGPEVAPIAFGGNVFGWTVDEAMSFQLLDAFVAGGFNLVDTADSYSTWVPGNKGGESETIIGKWMKQRGNRQQMVIATKVGSDMGQGKKDLSKKWVLKACEDSLRRLNTDYIDLYQSHWDDESTPVGETLEAYGQLVKEGKVRSIGASNLSPQRLQESINFSRENNLPVYQTLQPEYNLYSRSSYEKNYAPIVRKEGLAVIPYYALASGFLSGKYRSEKDAGKSARGSGVTRKYLNERGFRILTALDEISSAYQTSLTTISLAWLLTRPGLAAPIASATTKEQLEEIMQAATITLGQDTIAKLDEASAE
jgi:aryl-alcohol dehydrogenase-like predicted oxidoreductase